MRDDCVGILLDWYDANARSLPWRISPADRKAGVVPDPYSVWMSEIMLQQTTVAAVRTYFETFTRRWPSVRDLAEANDADVMAAWAGLGYYARARNLLACARLVDKSYGGRFPDSRTELLKLPGIGPYTASAIAAIAFDHPETVMDGNVERVMARLYAELEPLPRVKPILFDHAASLTPKNRPGDYAQAVMDIGATICTPRSPACGICPLAQLCRGRQLGVAATLPARAPKAIKATRRGTVFVARNMNGDWLIERRPPKGLLGGMLGFPCSAWEELPGPANPPLTANWQALDVEVRHTFTHFNLVLQVRVAKAPDDCVPERGYFLDVAQMRPQDLPSLMRKVFSLAKDWSGWNCQ